MAAPAWRLDPARGTAERLSAGPLSLNAIAKGYIVDRACEAAIPPVPTIAIRCLLIWKALSDGLPSSHHTCTTTRRRVSAQQRAPRHKIQWASTTSGGPGQHPVVSGAAGGETGAPHDRRSDREFEVMRGIASGESVGEIAVRMHLSVKTVSTYRTRLLEKMDMTSNAELTRYAIQNGLV